MRIFRLPAVLRDLGRVRLCHFVILRHHITKIDPMNDFLLYVCMDVVEGVAYLGNVSNKTLIEIIVTYYTINSCYY